MNILRRRPIRPLNVAVLGSGPAGLFAAQAVYDTGNKVQIFSRGVRSSLYGAQYLHGPVPSLDCGEARKVSYTLKGSVEDYRRKVYGDESSVVVSPDVLEPEHEAWDIRSAYANAWERFQGIIKPRVITQRLLSSDSWYSGALDLIVWSIPIAGLCSAGHRFESQTVWAQGDAPNLGQYCSVSVDPWTIVANGEELPRWYRASNVFGYRTAEWPDGPKPPVRGIALVEKPIRTDCKCWSMIGGAPVLRVGRYGTWDKWTLSHQAYFKTRSTIESM